MKNRTNQHTGKSGAALVIALGFLAVLTIIIVAFTVQTRTDRMAGRDFLIKAQTRHLLNTAMSHALEDIDTVVGTNYPAFLAMASVETEADDTFLADAISFDDEEAFIPGKGSPIYVDYKDLFENEARWQSVFDAQQNTPVGRVGYMILNTSGLLDANAVGGHQISENPAYTERKNGLTPEEIQLSPDLLPELSRGKTSLIFHDGTVETSNDAALALVYNRTHAWGKFETLRDFYILNKLGYYTSGAGNILTKQPESFRIFSFFPPANKSLGYMGSTPETLNENAVRTALQATGITGENQTFVLQQLKDYLDTDNNLQDLRYSVEPVPSLNEILLTFDFQLSVEISMDEETEDPSTIEITVDCINNCLLEVEAWMPHSNATLNEQFRVKIISLNSTVSPSDLFPDFKEIWSKETAVFREVSQQHHIYDASFSASSSESSYTDSDRFVSEFGQIVGEIDQLGLSCFTPAGKPLDLVANLKLPIEDHTSELAAIAEEMAEFIFGGGGVDGMQTNFTFSIGMGTIDPRLNWDGLNENHWVETGDNGYDASIGSINRNIIAAKTGALSKDEPFDSIYVRNEGRIDSVYEFTYFLQDTNRPWHTFQFFPENDVDKDGLDLKTREIANVLATERRTPDSKGFINPNTPHQNVLASAFYNMPVDEFVQNDYTETRRLSPADSINLFKQFAKNRPYLDRTDIIESLSYSNVASVIQGSTWENESVLRNAINLLATRDSTYTLLLAAQSGNDINLDGVIGDDEVDATQKAVACIWRDPLTGKTTCTFFGLSDTLQSSISGGQTWSTILQEFKP